MKHIGAKRLGKKEVDALLNVLWGIHDHSDVKEMLGGVADSVLALGWGEIGTPLKNMWAQPLQHLRAIQHDPSYGELRNALVRKGGVDKLILAIDTLEWLEPRGTPIRNIGHAMVLLGMLTHGTGKQTWTIWSLDGKHAERVTVSLLTQKHWVWATPGIFDVLREYLNRVLAAEKKNQDIASELKDAAGIKILVG